MRPLVALSLARPAATSTDALIRQLRERVAGRFGCPDAVLLHDHHLPARPPAYGEPLRPRLPTPLGDALRARGVERLYTHQVAAVQAARAGTHAVITTPTASGKTLCFTLPVLEAALRDPDARALYLYPTKALIGDQQRALGELVSTLAASPPVRAAVLHGDVPREARDQLRANPPQVLLANPDIVHFDLLLKHRRWARFLAGLRFVVLDELHAYRGVFGAHVGLILRRLLRLARAYGGRTPTLMAASATIANPAELAERLTGLPFDQTITGDGAGSSARRFLFWRPPLWSDEALNEHRSTTLEAVLLFIELLKAGRTTILFGKSRTAVERMLAEARQALGKDGAADLAARISAYKAGYTPEERRRIEADLRAGYLRGVIATNALELGIDVGGLDAAILAGYPGTVMSTWQQAGRVGRRAADAGQEALIVLVGGDDALDQFHLDHPERFFAAPSEQAVVDPGNEAILPAHLLCAAQERPLDEEDLACFPTSAPRLLRHLEDGRLLSAGPPWRLVASSQALPHGQVHVRGATRDRYAVLHDRLLLAHAEPPLLYREAHPGAVYLHNGDAYRVLEIDDAAHCVRVRPETADVRTDPVAEVSVSPRGEPLQRRSVALGTLAATATIGPLLAVERIAAYRETVGRGAPVTHPLEPVYSVPLDTIGLWLDLPDRLGEALEPLHALEHALVNALPVSLLCDRRDVGSLSDPAAGEGGRVYLFDRYAGGIGLSERAFLLLEDLLRAAAELLARCRCADGCPSCLHLVGCALGNDSLDKRGGLALLRGRLPATPWPRPRPSHRLREAPAPPLADRLRAVAETALRERLADQRPIGVGERLELAGVGPVTVLELDPDGARARVQYVGYRGWTWAVLSQLRR